MASKSCKRGSFHKIFTVFLLFTTVISFLFIYQLTHKVSDLPLEKTDILYKKQQLSDNLWLYVTVLETNATASNEYSYFLGGKINGDPLKKLGKPFLVGNRGDAEVSFKKITQKVGENRFSPTTGNPLDPNETEEIPYVMVKYSGKVFFFSNRSRIYNLKNNEDFYPNIDLKAVSDYFDGW